MDLGSVMDELGSALGTIAGLHVYPFSALTVHTPAAVVGFPESIEYDVAMGRGCDRIMLPVTVVVGQIADARRIKAALEQYASGSPASPAVKHVIENYSYTSCDTVRVQGAKFDAVQIGGQDYVAIQFEVEVIGGQ